jgi:hypothetical protein
MKEGIENGRLDLINRSPLAVRDKHLISALDRQPFVHHEGAEITLFEETLEVGSSRWSVGPWTGYIGCLGWIGISGYGNCYGNSEDDGSKPNDRGRISTAGNACVHWDVVDPPL